MTQMTVKGLRELLTKWENEHNSDPKNTEYLGKFEDLPVVTMAMRETAVRGQYEQCGLGDVDVLNNPRCLGIEIWDAERAPNV